MDSTDRAGGTVLGVALVTWPEFDPDDPQTGRRLRNAGLELRIAPNPGRRSSSELAPLVEGAVAAIVSTDRFERSVFATAKELRVVARVGVGTDSIDVEAATESGVVVTTTPGVNEETVADHTLAMMLAAVRRVVSHDASVRRGQWIRTGDATAWDLHASTIGIIGFGKIGKAVARRLQGFGATILVHDPAIAHSIPFETVELDVLLTRSDVVTLHVPLSSETFHLIGDRELALMRRDTILVNTSRGQIVDESCLVDVLESGQLRAAALDVFEDEPPLGSRLLDFPNVTLSPHVAGLSVRSVSEMLQRATEGVLDVLTGRSASDIVNPAALDVLARMHSATSDVVMDHGGV